LRQKLAEITAVTTSQKAFLLKANADFYKEATSKNKIHPNNNGFRKISIGDTRIFDYLVAGREPLLTSVTKSLHRSLRIENSSALSLREMATRANTELKSTATDLAIRIAPMYQQAVEQEPKLPKQPKLGLLSTQANYSRSEPYGISKPYKKHRLRTQFCPHGYNLHLIHIFI